jgi:hypothetical protein
VLSFGVPWEVVPLWFWVSNNKWEINWDYVPCTLCLIQLWIDLSQTVEFFSLKEKVINYSLSGWMRGHKLNLGNLTQSGFWVEIIFVRSQPWIIDGVEWSYPSIPRFLYGWFKRGAYGLRRLIHSFVHLESLRGEMETGMEAIFEGSFGTSFHGRAMKA